MFKRIIHNLFCRPGKKIESEEYVRRILRKDLVESGAPYVLYKGKEYYEDLTIIGYLPYFARIPERKMVLIYEFGLIDYKRLILPDYINPCKDAAQEFYEFEIMDYIRYGNFDLEILNFFNYLIRHNGKCIYSSISGEHYDTPTPQEFIEKWQLENAAKSDTRPYVN